MPNSRRSHMSPESDTVTETPSELPPATMETLMAQLGSAKANTTIVGSARAVLEEPAPERQATAL